MIPCGIPGLKYDSIRYHMVVDANPIVYAESDMPCGVCPVCGLPAAVGGIIILVNSIIQYRCGSSVKWRREWLHTSPGGYIVDSADLTEQCIATLSLGLAAVPEADVI